MLWVVTMRSSVCRLTLVMLIIACFCRSLRQIVACFTGQKTRSPSRKLFYGAKSAAKIAWLLFVCATQKIWSAAGFSFGPFIISHLHKWCGPCLLQQLLYVCWWHEDLRYYWKPDWQWRASEGLWNHLILILTTTMYFSNKSFPSVPSYRLNSNSIS